MRLAQMKVEAAHCRTIAVSCARATMQSRNKRNSEHVHRNVIFGVSSVVASTPAVFRSTTETRLTLRKTLNLIPTTYIHDNDSLRLSSALSMRRTKCGSLIRSTLVPSPELHLQALQHPVAATSSFRSSAADCDGPVEASCYEVRSPTCVAHLPGIAYEKSLHSEHLKQLSVSYV